MKNWKRLTLTDDIEKLRAKRHEYVVQEFELLEFYINNTKKPIAIIDLDIFNSVIDFELPEDSSILYLTNGYEPSKTVTKEVTQILLYRDEELCNKALDTFVVDYDDVFEIRGNAFGYPPQAIKDFVEFRYCIGLKKRLSINCNGIFFVCLEENIEKVKEEFENMYGFPIESNHISKM